MSSINMSLDLLIVAMPNSFCALGEVSVTNSFRKFLFVHICVVTTETETEFMHRGFHLEGTLALPRDSDRLSDSDA